MNHLHQEILEHEVFRLSQNLIVCPMGDIPMALQPTEIVSSQGRNRNQAQVYLRLIFLPPLAPLHPAMPAVGQRVVLNKKLPFMGSLQQHQQVRKVELGRMSEMIEKCHDVFC